MPSPDSVAEADNSALVVGEPDELADVATLGDGCDVFEEVADSDEESVARDVAVFVDEPRLVAVAIDTVAEAEADSMEESNAVAEAERVSIEDSEACELPLEVLVAAAVKVWLIEAVDETDGVAVDVIELHREGKPVEVGELVALREAAEESDDAGEAEDRIDAFVDPVSKEDREAPSVPIAVGDAVSE